MARWAKYTFRHDVPVKKTSSRRARGRRHSRAWRRLACCATSPGPMAVAVADLCAVARVALGIDAIESVPDRVVGIEGNGLPLVAEAVEEDDEEEESGLGYAGPDPTHRGRVTGEAQLESRYNGKLHRSPEPAVAHL